MKEALVDKHIHAHIHTDFNICKRSQARGSQIHISVICMHDTHTVPLLLRNMRLYLPGLDARLSHSTSINILQAAVDEEHNV